MEAQVAIKKRDRRKAVANLYVYEYITRDFRSLNNSDRPNLLADRIGVIRMQMMITRMVFEVLPWRGQLNYYRKDNINEPHRWTR